MSDYNSQLPIRTENNGDVVSRISDGTITTRLLTVNADGSINVGLASGAEVKITDGTDDLAINADGSINSVVTATDLDIRDLSHSQDSIKIGDGTDFLAIDASGNIGVTDAGGSLTVDATDLDIRDLQFATDKIDASGSEVSLDATTLAALESVTVQNGAGASAVNIQDGGNSITVDGSVTVSATNLDIRDLNHSSDSIKIGDGTDFLAINSDGSINVVSQDEPGTETVSYDTSAAIAGGATDNHDFLVTNGGKLFQVIASGSGKMKIEVQVETGSATGTFNTIGVLFNSTASPNMDLNLAKYRTIPTGARVRVIRTNRENQAQDVYSTIILLEN